MGGIIFWGILLLIWVVSATVVIFNQNSDARPGNLILALVMILLNAFELGSRIDDYKCEKVFNELLIGQKYIGTFKDDPFTRETITITNLVIKNDVPWVQYTTSKGDTVATKMDNIVDFFK